MLPLPTHIRSVLFMVKNHQMSAPEAAHRLFARIGRPSFSPDSLSYLLTPPGSGVKNKSQMDLWVRRVERRLQSLTGEKHHTRFRSILFMVKNHQMTALEAAHRLLAEVGLSNLSPDNLTYKLTHPTNGVENKAQIDFWVRQVERGLQGLTSQKQA